MKLVHPTDATPKLTPHTRRVPERLSVSLDLRVLVSGAPPVPDRLRQGSFEPADANFWVALDVGTREGRWSVYVWGPDERLRQSNQYGGVVRLGAIETTTPPPVWVTVQLNTMLAELKEKARLLEESR